MNFEQIDGEFIAEANEHWRKVAEYEQYVKPLIVRLQAVEWPIVVALYSAKWHRGAVEAIRAQLPTHHCCPLALSHQVLLKRSQAYKPSRYDWIGSYYNYSTGEYRRIQRYPLIYIHDTGTYPVRFCPPEGPPVTWESWFRISDFQGKKWVPEAHSWHSYEARREVVAKWLIDRGEAQRNGPNYRQYLADRLRKISRQLGRYERNNYIGASGAFYEDVYKLDFDLDKAITVNGKSGINHNFYPSTLGEVEAKVKHFYQCLNEFHKAEVPKPIKLEIQPYKRAYTSSQLVRDTYLHFPGVFEPFVGLDEPEGIRQWAMHLASIWATPRQHSAPSNYDAAYYNQSGSTRAEFLAALRRIQAAVWLALRAPEAERQLFEGRGLIPDGETQELRGQALSVLATRGAAWLLDWLSWREQKPTKQLLAALQTIELANTHLRLTIQEAERPPCLYVPDCTPAVEAERFGKLLLELRQNLPGKPAKLRALLAELELLRALPMGLLRTGPASELPTWFPMLNWPRLSQYPTDCALTATFWLDLEQALHTRREWATQAYEVVAGALNLPLTPPPPSVSAEMPAAEPANSYPWVEIEALAERIRLREGGRFLVPSNKVAAAGAGLIDALLDAGKLPDGTTRPELYAEFTRHYGQPIKAERTKPTRTTWHHKARQGLGLPDLKPPKKQA